MHNYKYFNGEKVNPYVNGSDEAKLWSAERIYDESVSENTNKEHSMSLEDWVCVYVSKWDPWEFESTLKVYFKDHPEKEKYIGCCDV